MSNQTPSTQTVPDWAWEPELAEKIMSYGKLSGIKAHSLAVDLLRVEGDVEAAEYRLRTAIAERKQFVQEAQDAGMPMREIGKIVGVSHQRIAQILQT